MTDATQSATKPTRLSFTGWWKVLKSTYGTSDEKYLSVVAAGVAFYGLLAVFPAIATLVALAGFFLDPQQMEQQIAALASALPDDAASILTQQAQSVAESGSAAGIGAIIGILLALYSASKGMKTLIAGMNIVYEQDESRGFFFLNAVAMGLTFFLIFGLMLALSITIVAPAVLAFLPMDFPFRDLINYARWPILAVATVFGLSVLFRRAPARPPADWAWVWPGALLATAIWVLGSVAFSVYVSNFGSYGETYGALAGVIILLMWLWLSSFIILLGATLNAELERTTRPTPTT